MADVVVSHPLAPAYIKKEARTKLGVATKCQLRKHRKYDVTAAKHHAQMLAFSMETCGGMAPDAETLLHIVADAGEEQLGLWPKAAVLKQLTGAVSIAVQRGNTMSFLAGNYRSALRANSALPPAGCVTEGSAGETCPAGCVTRARMVKRTATLARPLPRWRVSWHVGEASATMARELPRWRIHPRWSSTRIRRSRMVVLRCSERLSESGATWRITRTAIVDAVFDTTQTGLASHGRSHSGSAGRAPGPLMDCMRRPTAGSCRG